MPVPYVSINPSKKREVQAILDYNFDMKLYVIGNGFDLAHGMETSYGKYLSYVKQKSNDNNKWSDILDYYPEDHKFWSDAERYICKIEREPFLALKKYFGVCLLEELLIKIRDSFESFIINAEQKIDLLPTIFKLDSNAFFLTFNYTSVLEELYKIDANRIIHLHNTTGDAVLRQFYKLDANELVLGHGPQPTDYFFWSDSQVGSDKDYIQFRNKTQKNTQEIIRKNGLWEILAKLQKHITEVVFFGFSFAPADKDCINTINMFISPQRAKYIVYYHIEDGETDNDAIERLSNNMIASAVNPNDFVFLNGDITNAI